MAKGFFFGKCFFPGDVDSMEPFPLKRSIHHFSRAIANPVGLA